MINYRFTFPITPEEYKYSLGIRVDRVTPGHVYCSMFSGLICEEYEHHNATRGKAGNTVVSVREFQGFLNHHKPHVFSLLHEDLKDDLLKYTGVRYGEFHNT